VGIWRLVVATAFLAGGVPATVQGDEPSGQPPLLPPIDSQVLDGRILFAFGDEGLLAPPSLIGKDGSLVEVQIHDKDLDAGLPSVVSLLSPTGVVYGLGDLHGKVSSKGKLTLEGGVSIVPGSSFVLDDGHATATGGGQVRVRVEESQFKSAQLEDVEAVVVVPLEEEPLKLEGVIGGTYEPGRGVSFKAELAVEEPFVYEKDSVKATLQPGGVRVTVEDGRLKRLEFREFEAAIVIVVEEKPLELHGTISEGGYEPDTGISLEGELELDAPFEYEKGSVTVTLQPGSVSVTLHEGTKNRWVKIRQADLPPLKIELDDDDDEDDDDTE
jgi:hypothetical protein